MGLIEDIALKLERLESIPEDLINATERAQREIFREMNRLLAQFDVKDGAFVVSEANLNRTAELIARLNVVAFEGIYGNAVKAYAGEFTTQRALNDSIFEPLGFEDKEVFKVNWAGGRKNAINLLSKDQVAVKLLEPINQALTTAVTTGQSFAGTVEELTRVVNGIDPDGELLKHVKRVARDSFNIADRSYTEIVIKDLGIEWFRYSGGLVKDSRQFCVDRVEKIWHIKEILKWGVIPAEWQGRNQDTNPSNIFVLLGGWNCLHSLVPVDVSIVPESVIEKVKAKGFI